MQQKTQKLLSLTGLMQVACLLVVICSLAPFFAQWLWYLDLLVSFRFQYLVLSVVFTLGFVLSKHRIYAMASWAEMPFFSQKKPGTCQVFINSYHKRFKKT